MDPRGAPHVRHWSGTAAFVAPRTPVEELLAAIWAEALETPVVGVDDAFVDLGGDSLRALAVVHAVRDRLQLEVHAPALLASPTVAEMAEVVTAALAGRLRDGARDQLLGRLDPG